MRQPATLEYLDYPARGVPGLPTIGGGENFNLRAGFSKKCQLREAKKSVTMKENNSKENTEMNGIKARIDCWTGKA